MNFLRFLFFAFIMLFCSGLVNGQGTEKLLGSNNPSDTNKEVANHRNLKASGNGIRITYYDNNGNQLYAPFDTIQLKSNLSQNLSDNSSTLYPSNPAVNIALDNKSPVINDSFGYQYIGSFPDLITTSSSREGLLFERNGVISNIYTNDTSNLHVSLAGRIMFRQSKDTMRSFGCYSDSCIGALGSTILYNGEYDDRNIGGYQFDDGSFVLFFRQRQNSTISTYGFITFDSLGNNRSIFTPITYPFATDLDAPGFFGKMYKGGDGNLYQAFYATDSACIMQWTGSGFTVKLRFGRSSIAEPAISPIGSSNWLVITRNEAIGEGYQRSLWTSTDNFGSINYVGFITIDTVGNNKTLYRTPTGIKWDSLSNKVIILSSQRRQLVSGRSQLDSMRIDMATPQQAMSNLFTGVDIVPRAYYSGLANYWYPSMVQIGNKIYGQISMSYGSGSSSNPPAEVSHLYKFFINPVYPKSNGGLNALYGNGIPARESKIKGVFSYIIQPPMLNTSSIALPDGGYARFYSNSWGLNLTANSITSPIFQTTAFSTRGLNVAQKYNNTATTGMVTFKHQRLGISTHHDLVITGAALNNAWNFEARVGFFVQTSTVIGSNTTTQGFYANIVGFTGTLPFDTLRVSISSGDSIAVMIGDSLTNWTANSRINVDRWDIGTFNGTSSLDVGWQGGYTSSIQPNYYSFLPNAISKKVFTKNLNESSALNGSNIIDGTVSSDKIRDTTIRAIDMKPFVTRSSASTLTLAYGNDYTFTGTTATYTLPAIISTTLGRAQTIVVTNQGSGTITLNTNASANVLFTGVSLTNTLSIVAGQTYLFRPDGINFIAQLQ